MQTMLTTAVAVADWRSVYSAQLAAHGRSTNTVKAYLQDLGGFVSWYESANGQTFSPELITSLDLRQWRTHSIDVEQASPATWNRRRISMKIFCDWAFNSGYVNYNPFQGVLPAEEVTLAPRWLTKSEYHRFMRAAEQGVNAARTSAWQAQAVRDYAMIELMARAGLREGEVAGLDLHDVELSERKGRVIVRRGKGGKRREVPLNVEVRQALVRWLELRGNQPGPLFTGKGSARLSTRSIQRRVAEIGRLAGVDVTPHQLRHTFAKRVLDAGGELTEVKELLGHVRLETTARYTKASYEDLERAVERV